MLTWRGRPFEELSKQERDEAFEYLRLATPIPEQRLGESLGEALDDERGDAFESLRLAALESSSRRRGLIDETFRNTRQLVDEMKRRRRERSMTMKVELDLDHEPEHAVFYMPTETTVVAKSVKDLTLKEAHYAVKAMLYQAQMQWRAQHELEDLKAALALVRRASGGRDD